MGLTRPRAYQIYDIDYKQAVRAITTTNVTLSGGAPSSVDGVSLSFNDRVLVNGQTNKVENGIYQVSVLGTGSNGTWVRSGDSNQTGELLSGTIVMVTEGLTYADTSWKLVTDDPITIGVTELTFDINTGNAFGTINANGIAVVADSATGTVTFAPANNMVITGNAGTDTVSFAVSDSPTFAGNVTASYFLGNGSQLTGIQAGSTLTFSNTAPVNPQQGDWWIDSDTGVQVVYFNDGTSNQWAEMEAATSISITESTYGNANVAAFLPTYSGNIGNGSGYLFGNGSFLTGLPSSYGNANVADYLLTFTGNIAAGNVSATGNVTAAYFVGNGSQLTGISTSTNRIFSGTSNVDIASANANITMSVAGTSNVVVVSSTGLAVTGTVTGNGIAITTVSNTAPTSPEQGDIWINVDNGRQYIYFDAGGNSQWADMESALSISSTGNNVTTPVPLANLTAIAGSRAFVNDSNLVANSATFGSQVGSGGSNVVPVWSDGTNWYIG